MSINEIANLAGVSKSTVSRYLNGGYVSDSAKEKIKKVINETGFKPSIAAKALRTKVTKQIGVIIPKLNSDSISKMVAGITEVLRNNGYYLLLANVDNNEELEINYLSLFNENHVDGIIYIASVFTEKHNKALKKVNVPLVILSQYHKDYPCVYFDNFNASKEITKVLLKGHKYPGLISARLDDISAGKERQDGFYDALKEMNLDVFGVEYSKFSIQEGALACKRLIEKNPKVDAIFATTDSIAVGALTYLLDIGKKVPEEVSIVSVGGGSSIRITNPRITSANLEYYESGRKSANIILSIIKKEDIQTKVKTSFKIQIQQTTL